MNYIVADIRAMDYSQTVSVYIEGECVKTVRPTIHQVVDTVASLSSEFGINKIDLIGNLDFLQKFQRDLSTSQFSNYEINIIGR